MMVRQVNRQGRCSQLALRPPPAAGDLDTSGKSLKVAFLWKFSFYIND